MMFNKEVKNEFLQTVESKVVYSVYMGIFKKMKVQEEFLNKDLSTFTFNEAMNCLSLLESSTSNTIETYVSRIRTYTRWCISHGMSIDGMNHWDEVTKDCMKKYAVRMDKVKFVTEEMLHDFVEMLDNATDKFLFTGLFYGIRKPDEILGITMEDIKKGNPIIVNKGTKQERKFIMPKEMFEYAYETRQEDYYKTETSETTSRLRKALYYKENEDRIIKRKIDIDEYTNQHMSRRFNRIKKRYPDIKFTMEKLYPSGFYLAVTKEAKKHGEEEDPGWFLAHDLAIKPVLEQYGYKYPDEIASARQRFVRMKEIVEGN